MSCFLSLRTSIAMANRFQPARALRTYGEICSHVLEEMFVTAFLMMRF